MRRIAVLLTVGVLGLAGCSEQRGQMAGPSSQQGLGPSFALAPSGPSCTASSTDIYDLIDAIFPAGNDRTAAEARFDNIDKLLARGTAADSQTAKEHTLTLVAFTLNKYYGGRLLPQTPPATLEDAVMQLVNSWLCYAGLPTVPDGALDPDGAIALIYPTTDSTVVTGSKQAGADFDSGSVSEPILVTISRIDPYTPPGPLATLLDQYPPFYEFHMSPQLPSFEIPVLVGVCPQVPDQTVLDRVKLAHNVSDGSGGTTVEILDRVAAPFVDCVASQASNRSGFRLFDLAASAVRPIVRAILPTELLAATFATSGVGGTVRTFSPFGVVDPEVDMDATSSTSQVWPIGGTVPETPAVRLHTYNGSLLPGINVTFAVAAGGGSLTGAAPTTDAAGLAAAGSWTLGLTPGLNTVTATATPPHAGSYVTPAPLTFSATATPPTQLQFRVQPSGTTAGFSLTPPVQVAVLDDYANVVTSSGAPVTLGLGTAPTGATLGGTAMRNAALGVATFADLFLTRTGTYTLVATSGSLRSATSNPFTITADAASLISIVAGDGQQALEGTAVAVAPTVKVTDQYGNPVSGVQVEFIIASGGGSITGAIQTTDATGRASVGSWTLAAGTNTLYATSSVGTVTFTATGLTLQDVIANCLPSSGTGDDLTRGFYFPNSGNARIGRLGQVTLYMSSNDQASSPTRYVIELIARSGGFGGSEVGRSQADVAFRGTTSENQPVNFVFAGGRAVPSNAPLVFELRVVSADAGARGGLRFNTGPCGLGDSKCKTSCPVIETNSTSSAISLSSNFRRKSCGIEILGSRQ